jgi:predicted glutamine amidotransferase
MAGFRKLQKITRKGNFSALLRDLTERANPISKGLARIRHAQYIYEALEEPMCRFALYLGGEIPISALITEPVNSLIHQSFHSHERDEPLNGDGFGIAWYPPTRESNPAVFRSTTPAWSNHNLRELARVTQTRCLLAHVRAATPGLPVSDLNCHPFAVGRIAFMHNGDLGGFRFLRRRLLSGLSDESFDSIRGSTDSEHIFAVLLDHLRSSDKKDDPTVQLAIAMEQTIRSVEALRQNIAPDKHAYLNLVACDGDSAVISRYSSDRGAEDSLYFSAGRMYMCAKGLCHMDTSGCERTAVIVASEPLDDDGSWTPVDPGTMVLVSPDLKVTTRPITGA